MRGDKLLIFLFLLTALLLVVFFISSSFKNNLVIHPIYGDMNYSSPIETSQINSNSFNFTSLYQTLDLVYSITDDAVYSTGYISYDGGEWQPVSLTGEALAENWISGTASLNLALTPSDFGLNSSKLQASNNYLLVYTCNYSDNSWDCYDNFWQLSQFNASLTLGALLPNSCGNGIIEGSEICDSGELNGAICEQFGYHAGGTLACTDNCRSYNYGECSTEDGYGTGSGNYQYTYYIDPTASPGGNGLTPATAFDSWSDIGTIQNNAQYLMKKGTTFIASSYLYILNKNNVRFGTYGAGDKPYIIYTGGQAFFKSDGSSNIIFDGYNIKNDAYGNYAVIEFSAHGGRDANNGLIRNCELSGGWRGINSEVWESELDSYLHGILIENCIVHNISLDGIFVKSNWNDFGNLVIIRNSHVYDVNMKFASNPGAGDNDGDAIHLLRVNNSIIENNILDKRKMGYKFTIIVTNNNNNREVNNTIIRFNTIYPPTSWISLGCVDQPNCGGGCCAGSALYIGVGPMKNAEIYLNKFINRGHLYGIGDANQVGFGTIDVDSLNLSYNVFDNFYNTANIGFSGYTSPIVRNINNNVFYFPSSQTLFSTSNIVTNFRNNIFLIGASGSLYNDGMHGGVNVHKQNNIELYSNDANYFQSQLHFVNFPSNTSDYHLTSTSSLAIDQGIEYSGAFNFDLDGNFAPIGVRDIGPYEFI